MHFKKATSCYFYRHVQWICQRNTRNLNLISNNILEDTYSESAKEIPEDCNLNLISNNILENDRR